MLKEKYEAEAARDNPWKTKEDSIILQDVKQNKKKRGKKEIPDCFKFNQQGLEYIGGLSDSHREETESIEWKR
jgi:hypothetical protein